VTDVGIIAFVILHKLEELKINYINNITDNGLKYIHNLKKLKCQDCSLITDHGISEFIKASPKLRLLDVSGCNISSAIIQIAKDACNNRTKDVLKLIMNERLIPVDIENDKSSPFLKIVRTEDNTNKNSSPSYITIQYMSAE